MSSVVAGPVFEDGISTAAVAQFRRAGRVHVALRRGDDAGTIDGLASRGWTSSRPLSTSWPIRPRRADRCCAS